MIPKQQIEAAKQANLPDVLRSLGIEIVLSGANFQSKNHDSLKFFRQNGVWLYKWWSRNGEVGDGVQYLMRYCLLSFPEAVAALSGSPITKQKAPGEYQLHRPILKPQKWKTTKWQTESKKLIQFSRSCLFGPNGKERLSYLVQERGLQIDTIRHRCLGWLPPKKQMPSKLVIPSYDSRGDLVRIRFRMDKSGPEQERYRISKGSNPKDPFPINVASGKPIMILESELDAILVAQEVGDLIGILGMGTTALKFDGAIADYLIKNIPAILISLDNDQSGRAKTTQLIKQFPHALDWSVPKRYGKDPGEAWKHMGLRKWVKSGLEKFKK
jgi:DNA primase